MLLQPDAALRERLGMRADALEAAQRAHCAHQVVMDAQLHLAADLERRAEQPVERVIDGAFRRVLDRYHAEVGAGRLHLVKHLIDRGQRQRAHGMAEMSEHGGLREGAFGPQKRHLDRKSTRLNSSHRCISYAVFCLKKKTKKKTPLK